MYTPEHFNFNQVHEIEAFIKEHSFATLISCNKEEPIITQAPIIRLSNGKLVGHFARANPHAQVQQDSPITAIFHGPHAYISANYYSSAFNVPTWNYITVHCRGTIEFIDSEKSAWNYFEEMVEFFEGKDGWKLPSEESYKQLLSAIRFFEITNETFQGKAKFNQNKTQGDIQSVIDALIKSNQHQAADMMKKVNFL